MSKEQNTPEPLPDSKYYEMFVETPKQMKTWQNIRAVNVPQYSHHLPCLKGTLISITKIAIPQYSYLTIQVAQSNVFSAAKKSVQPLALIRLKKHLSETHKQSNITINIKCNNCSSSFGNCVQASNHFKKYHGAIKNNLPAGTTTNIGKKENNIVPTIDTPETLATPTKGSSSIQHAAPVSTNDKLTLLEETRKNYNCLLILHHLPIFLLTHQFLRPLIPLLSIMGALQRKILLMHLMKV